MPYRVTRLNVSLAWVTVVDGVFASLVVCVWIWCDGRLWLCYSYILFGVSTESGSLCSVRCLLYVC